jgi:hypothetical protein
VQLIQVLLEVLSFLFELKIISRNGVFKLLVGILDLLKLQLKLNDFINSVVQVPLKLLLNGIVFFLLSLKLLFYNAVCNLFDVWLLFLQFLIQSLLEVQDFTLLIFSSLIKLIEIFEHLIVTLKGLS